jgi:hypothetical protein
MNRVSVLLIVDAFINYALGFLCLIYPYAAETIGVPMVENSFYPNILGAVLIGIGVALTIECFSKRESVVGLGLVGAVVINLSGAVVLILWLAFGNLNMPPRGYLFLWSLAVILIVISLTELILHLKGPKRL